MAVGTGKFFPFCHVHRHCHPHRSHGGDGRAARHDRADG